MGSGSVAKTIARKWCNTILRRFNVNFVNDVLNR